ncbi:MAG: M20/M25/M40 family metallo-hydrolase [Trueperaceae bacterium]
MTPGEAVSGGAGERFGPPFRDDGDAAAELRALLRSVCEVAAPPFAEQRRAEHVASVLRRVGHAPGIDAAGNVVVDLPGGEGPTVALVAHLDTVFGPDVDVTVREVAENRWEAPGIGDNSASVAVLLHLAAEVRRGTVERRPRLMLAFTVGEEGLGDLRGVRHVVAERGGDLDVLLAVDGHLGTVVDAGVGSTRYKLAFAADGGHAWGDYPSPSAVHALGDAIHAVQRIEVPDAPRSSLNVGVIQGGSAINAIAEEAWAMLDLRSLDAATLEAMAREAEKRVRSVARRHDVRLHVERVGDRPAGRSDDGALTTIVRDTLCAHGHEVRVAASSTDANAAMAAGVPALCFGVYRGGDAHRLGEWADPTSLPDGVRVLREVLTRLAGTRSREG